LSSLSLQNIAIFPSPYSASISPLVLTTSDSSATISLSWANVHFQVLLDKLERVCGGFKEVVSPMPKIC